MSEISKKGNIKVTIIVALCFCLAICTVGGVWALLTDQTDEVTNTFVPATVTCSVEEDFINGQKSNVKVKNTGNVNAYIRATVVATFVTDENKILSQAPVEGVDYTVTWGDSKWAKGSDGYWYYSDEVSPSDTTTNLIESATKSFAPNGSNLNLQIIATAIQSDPAEAVQSAWGIAPINGKIIPQ